MTGSRYSFDQAWEHERARLAGIEALWDEGSQTLLERCGSASAPAILEVGAGGGSLVQWLAAQAADNAVVVATDLDTRFIDPLAETGGRVRVDIRQADIVADTLETNFYDLVHIRMLLEHLAEADAAIGHLTAALRPGGWLVAEDLDWTPFGFQPESELTHRAADAVLDLMARGGFDRTFGRRLPEAVAAHGMEDLRCEGRSKILEVTDPGAAFFQLSFDEMAPTLVATGMLGQQDADTVRAGLVDGSYRIVTPTLVAAIARKPI